MDKEVEISLGKLSNFQEEQNYEEDCLQEKCGVVSSTHTKVKTW
jgi:hypothetical protein